MNLDSCGLFMIGEFTTDKNLAHKNALISGKF
jgi:hypothetical protein